MNDSQNTAAGTSGQYGSTRNPQTPGGQNLSDTATNLQTTTPNLFTGNNNVSITSVGDSSFSPYSPENTTTTSVTQTPVKTSKHPYPILIGSAVLVMVVLIVSWLMIRKQPSY